MISELYTKRLYLRRLKESDSSTLFKIWSDPVVTKHMNISHFMEEKQAKDMITFLNTLAYENKAARFTIIELASNKIIGSCGYNTLDFAHSKSEIGYELSKAFWGKGYASEAISGLLKYAFEDLGLNRIEAKVEPQNTNSIKTLQRLNFTLEGTLRQAEKSKGKFVDLNLYSRLKTDP
ncbi:GNAT family N-acetyltransferase [Priestia filamentosa]|uniref:GNAT family N-acetyltransferase n=1 Tax=Priestia filamentosa TaxID=1402861 RepID=UPI0002FB3B5D|nr:GNAT family protein [Priestia filamentosa]